MIKNGMPYRELPRHISCLFMESYDHETESSGRMLKKTLFAPAQPRRVLHPPALSLPRQPLRRRARFPPSVALAALSKSVKRISLFVGDLRDSREKRDWSEVGSARVAPVVHVPPVSLTFHERCGVVLLAACVFAGFVACERTPDPATEAKKAVVGASASRTRFRS